MKTVTELLADMATSIKQAASELLLKHSHLKKEPHKRLVSGMVGTHCWIPLPVEGSRIQSKIREDYERFCSLLRIMLRAQPTTVRGRVEVGRRTVLTVIAQHGRTRNASVEEAFERFEAALSKQLQLLQALYDGTEGEHVYVPDTNALLYNTRLEDWHFDESPRFVLVLMPTVLSELDELKIVGKSESVREKAERLVRQLKEYRRRGNLNEGVVLRRDSHGLRTLAVEPDFENTLPWLDPTNNDDRILAGFLEVMRQHPRGPVTLVTRDINLTNKADYARVPCVEPPEPPAPGTAAS